MESIRAYKMAVTYRSIVVSAVAAVSLVLAHQTVAALALVAGSLIGLANLFHIAGSFNRLVKGGKSYLPFLPIEGVLRVLLCGAAPFFIVGRGPWLGYFTYIAGFVAPLAVAILVYQQQINASRVKPDAANT
ncbi:MAG: hypothetical protein M3007_02145 [Candidatus Eremiobacteraeota bacterium]|nr:hypothetical protein [Candidatus Eremiobacteraeota bacterium]